MEVPELPDKSLVKVLDRALKTHGLDGRIAERWWAGSGSRDEQVEENQAPKVVKEENKLQAKTQRKKRVTEVAEILGVDAEGKTQEELWDAVVQRLKVNNVKSGGDAKNGWFSRLARSG